MIEQTNKSWWTNVRYVFISYQGSNMIHLITLLALALILMACGVPSPASTQIAVQTALQTPTLEPTFTSSPPPTTTPQPSPTATPTEPTPTATPRTVLSGRILDQDTSQPISGATVRVGAATASTDADGRYTLTGLPPGQYVLSVTHPDYDPGLSSIFTLAAGEEQSLNPALYAPDTSPYPKDPMLTNPLDPNGAPTAKDAERLARLQGLTGDVVDIREIKLSGEYLVNYKIGDEVRAAVADLNHDVWELTDEAGRAWWIIQVCGNLASLLPEEAPIATPQPRPLPPMAEVIVDGLIVWECASEECAQVRTVQRGTRIEVIGCLADGDWCQVSLSGGGSGWCVGRSLGQLAVAKAVPMVEAILPTVTPEVTVRDDVDWIAYLGQDSNIWLIDPITGEQQRLTQSGEASSGPAWSPDGTRLAVGIGGYYHPDGVTTDLAIVDLANGDLKRLGIYEHKDSVPPVAVGKPAWSPDASIIYYSMTLDPLGRDWHLRQVQLHGEGREGVPPFSPNWFREEFPAFSPDGQWMTIGLVKQRALIPVPDSNWGIWLAEANGQNPRQLTTGVTGRSAWSPDSTQIAYDVASGVRDHQSIFVVNIDGSNTKHLTDNAYSPTWSPDGQQIAFTRVVDDHTAEIWVMNADGTSPRKIADGGSPAWRPARR
jgi:hypothetical protein